MIMDMPSWLSWLERGAYKQHLQLSNTEAVGSSPTGGIRLFI